MIDGTDIAKAIDAASNRAQAEMLETFLKSLEEVACLTAAIPELKTHAAAK